MPVFPSPWELILKKGAHLTVYAVLALLNLRALRIKGLSRDAALLGALAIVMIYAASDEFHQSFVTGRGASVRDVGIDLTGALLALSGAGLGLRLPGGSPPPNPCPIAPTRSRSSLITRVVTKCA